MVDYYLALTVINVILVAVLALVTLFYAWTTRQMLEENRLQRLQDAEIRTMPKKMEITTASKKDTLLMTIFGGWPLSALPVVVVRDFRSIRGSIQGDIRGDTNKESKHLATIGKLIDDREDVYLYHISLDELNLEKYGTEGFHLDVQVVIRSFLGHHFRFIFLSKKLLRDEHSKLHLLELQPGVSGFLLVNVETPWDKEQKH